jgi:outer membrane receptor protein involved in Fe transport
MYAFAPAARLSARRSMAAAFLGFAFTTLSTHALADPAQVLAASTSVGTVQGIVVSADGSPLGSVKVQLINANGKVVAQAETDQHGLFTINGVVPGSYTVTALKSSDSVSAQVEVSAGAAAQTRLALGSEKLATVTVTAQRFERARNELSPSTGSSQYTFTEKAIQQLPEGDHTSFNHVLLQAPGVANDAFGQVHVRGDHNDLQYRINGIILPDGVSAFSQVFDPRFAKSITLNTGALPAEYGLRTAGVIDIETKDSYNGGDVDFYGGSHDTVNPSFQLGKTVGPFTAYVTGQYLSNNLGVENTTGSYTAQHDWTSQGKGFGYFSWVLNPNMKLSALVGATGTRLEVPNIGGLSPNSAYVGGLDTAGFDTSELSSNGLNERQYERNLYDILALQGFADRLTYQVALFDRTSTLEFEPDQVGDLAFNGYSARLKRKASTIGLQSDLYYRLTDSHTLGFGLSASTENDRSDNTSQVFRATQLAQYPSGNCPAGSTLDDTGTYCLANGANGNPAAPIGITDNEPKNGNTLLSLYVQDKWDVTENLIVNYGLRYDKVNAYTSGSQLSPRIGLLDYLTPSTTIHAGYARYFTPPPTESISAGSVAAFANTTNAAPLVGYSTNGGSNCVLAPNGTTPTCALNNPVLPERSHYFDAGITHQLTSSYNVGLDAYYRHASNLIDEGQFGTAVIFTPFNYEQGHVYGIEFTNAYHSGNLSADLNIARSVAQGTNVISAQAFGFGQTELNYIASHYVYLDHDQRWTGSAEISYKWLGTLYGLEGTYGSGLRQGFSNTGKLPDNMQVDASATHDFHFGGGFGDLGVRLAVLNIFDRTNQVRSNSGVGVGAPQFSPRLSWYMGITKPFTL